jgi:hypothetical protein
MIQVEINGNDYDLAEGWNEITVEKFERIMKHSLFLKEYKSQTLFALEMFAILLDAPIEDIKKLSKASFEVLTEKCAWANTEITSSNKNEFHINNKVYISVKDFDSLNMGDAISLEIMMSESKSEEVLGNILPMLVREAKPVVKAGETVLVAGDFNADEYKELRELFVKNIMITDVIGLQNFF